MTAVLWAGVGAVLGHAFPVWLGFRGGKAVATSYGVLIAAAWPVGLCAGAVWLAMAALARDRPPWPRSPRSRSHRSSPPFWPMRPSLSLRW